MARPSYGEVVDLQRFDPTRATDKDTTNDRLGAILAINRLRGMVKVSVSRRVVRFRS